MYMGTCVKTIYESFLTGTRCNFLSKIPYASAAILSINASMSMP